MKNETPRTHTSWAQRMQAAYPGLLFALGVLAAALIMLVTGDAERALTLQVGDVAPRDILAPYNLTYESRVLTEQRREAAAAAVAPVYAPPDPAIARRQLEQLRSALDFVSQVRADPYASDEQKRADLQALKGVRLTPQQIDYLLRLSDAHWEAIQKEAERVLEQVMRASIRESQLPQIRRTLPTLVRLDFSPEQAGLVVAFVEAYLTPNSLYSPELTQAAQEQARQAVPPVERHIRRGETIVQRGQVLTAADIEALAQYGLLKTHTHWQIWLAPLFLLLGIMGWLALYLRQNRPLRRHLRALALLITGGLLWVLGARLLLPGHIVLPYLYPFPLFMMTVALLVGREPALIFGFVIDVLGLYGLPNGFELFLFQWLGGAIGVFALGRQSRMRAYFWSGGLLAAGQSAVMLAFRLPSPDSDWLGMATLSAAALVNAALSSGGSLLLHYLLAPLLDVVAPLQLLELARPDHPLLQRLLQQAPGTYQHSLQVANLAEQAAERIGADPLLTRVGALYHDIGKAENPAYFIENLPLGVPSPHEALSPEESAAYIIRHVTDGLALAQKHRLPKPIQAFIAEHHGTSIARYQYAQALEAAGNDPAKVDIRRFRYPGPRPRSKETAIVMLADGCEARVRAEHPTELEVIRALVRRTWRERLDEGQLDEAPLTLRDLAAIEDAFVEALKGLYHSRIRYPQVSPTQPVEETPSLDETAAPEPQEVLFPHDDLSPR
ncbi:MAG TPA: HDIG domain-containing protein [Anaerolineae bacterium]|nr:HDIG domain-containing protein [Anaerolineae bacterium]HID84029.1 HDIG domain-containing protein [Anaerolineales bacterium]HIQ08018.1 HDIG domain-containing protein [Anaerolineaceae bacterium]